MVLNVCRRVLGDSHAAEDACQGTFLLLVEKASQIHNTSAVGSWLHGTARRVSSDLRAKLARRAARPLPAELAAPTSDDERARALQELLAALDEELARLPNRYRAPLVLCYLEGRSRDEAALQLGWSIGTVRGCLERGRQVLRKRLLRRGLSLPAVLLTAGVADAGVRAAPDTIVRIVKAGIAVKCGGPGPAVGDGHTISPFLSRGVKTMLGNKKKAFLLAVLIACVTAGGVAYRTVTAPSVEVAWAADQPVKDLPAEAMVELAGRVVKPDGTSAVGAKVAAGGQVHPSGRPLDPRRRTRPVSPDPDGHAAVRRAGYVRLPAALRRRRPDLEIPTDNLGRQV
jgi:RNA polymerase sigma factor (sigma-70 family)